MRFVIDSHTIDGLKVIPEIPNIPPVCLKARMASGKL